MEFFSVGKTQDTKPTHNNSQPEFEAKVSKQGQAFTRLCASILNTKNDSITFEQRLAHFDRATGMASGPLKSIMVKFDVENYSIDELGALQRNIKAGLIEKLGEETFARLKIGQGRTPDGKFYLELNPAVLESIQLSQLTPLSDQIDLTALQFEALKKEYLDTAMLYGIVRKDSPAFTLIQNMTLEEFKEQINSIELISNLGVEDKEHVAYQRDLFSVFPDRSSDKVNSTLLGANGSAVRNGGFNSKYVSADGQVSMLIKTSYGDGTKGEKITHPNILSVSAPALDVRTILRNKTDSDRPEIPTYINTETNPPTFLEDNYRTAFENLSAHVLRATEITHPKRVVLCAYGCGAFLGSLEMIDLKFGTKNRDAAMNIAAASFANLIETLRAQGKEVVFTDFRFASKDFWAKVNSHLKDPITQIVDGYTEGSIGQGWSEDTDLLVNAWDPDSLLGNKGASDNTADGQYGRRSTMQFIHFIACAHHNGKLV